MTQIDPEAVVRLRAVIGRLARQLNVQLSDVGLTASQLSVLGSVARCGPLGVGELAELEGINPTMLSRIVGKLDELGLIAREPHPADARAAVVSITAAGRGLHERVRTQRARLLSDRLERMPAERVAQVLEALPALEDLALELVSQRQAARRKVEVL